MTRPLIIPTTLPINELIVVDSWNIRASELVDTIIAEYAANYSSLPPVTGAKLDGAIYLVDGWHRIAAARRLGRTEITIAIDPTLKTERDAKLAAATRNFRHGLFLTRRQKRSWYLKLKSLYREWDHPAWAKSLGVEMVTLSQWEQLDLWDKRDTTPQRASAEHRAGVIGIEKVITTYRRWHTTELRRFPTEKWSSEYRQRVKAQLKPIVEFYNALD